VGVPAAHARSGRGRLLFAGGLAALLLLGGALRTGRGEDPKPAEDPPKAPLPPGQLDSNDEELARALNPLLEARADWKDLLALRRELRQALPVGREPGPEGLKEAEAIRGKLDRAARLVDALAVSGRMARAAAEFLRRDVHEMSRVAQRLDAHRRGADPSAQPPEAPVEANVKFLAETLGLLEEVVSRSGPRPELADDILESLGPRFALLSETKTGLGTTPERRKTADDLRNSLKAVMDALRRPRGLPLDRDPRWARFLSTWERVKSPVEGKTAWPGAKAGWEALLASLDEASRLLDALEADGTLGEGEVFWARQEFKTAADGVRGKYSALRAERMTAKDPNDPFQQPVPVPAPLAPFPPDEASLRRLKDRLPLLEKLAAQDRVRPEILLRFLGEVEADLDRLARLPGHRDGEAVKRTKALLASIKAK
jgi:hypothetical protein